MKKIIAIISSLFFLTTISAKSEIQYGFGLMGGLISTDGTETEGTAADTSSRDKKLSEMFYGADVFVEYVAASELTLGFSYVPVNFEIGSGTRVDASAVAENDTGTRSAQAEVSDLMSLYANIPIADSGWYGLLGGMRATIVTNEALNESSYGDETVNGYQVGFGQRIDKFKYEFSYTDFEDINITAVSTGTNSVTADADVLAFRVSVGF
jgi:hypothetical protein